MKWSSRKTLNQSNTHVKYGSQPSNLSVSRAHKMKKKKEQKNFARDLYQSVIT